MEFINHTPFPALAFAGIDTREQAFHVVVLRQTLTWAADGTLHFADTQLPLCEEDRFFGEMNLSSVRQESDLCHYKPKCDVIVNGVAYPPPNKHRFSVRLKVSEPASSASLPPKPRGLNPLTMPDEKSMREWRRQVELAKKTMVPGRCLIDKALTVTGERHFVRRSWLSRTIGSLIRANKWRLTAPSKATPTPMRYELAFGGQCRANVGDAVKVAKKYRLTETQLASHPDAGKPADLIPIAHQVFAANPCGRGYATQWHIDAFGYAKIPAPLIEDPAQPITAALFESYRRQSGRSLPALPLAGFGIRPKSHPDRAKLVGTIDDAFINSDAPLPEDFDFAVWNAAPEDQQTDFLRGDEVIEMTNLCAADTPGIVRDEKGNTRLVLTLPGHLPFMLVRFENGGIGELVANLDTLFIEPEERRISCVWRATLATEPRVRVLEARMLERSDVVALREQQSVEVAHG